MKKGVGRGVERKKKNARKKKSENWGEKDEGIVKR